MKLFNLTDTAQPVMATDGSSYTILAHDSADMPDVDAKTLAREFPERFSLQAPASKPVKKSKKEN